LAMLPNVFADVVVMDGEEGVWLCLGEDLPADEGNRVHGFGKALSLRYLRHRKTSFHLGMGGLDIYVVENLGSTWGEPINLGIIVNTVNNDTHFQYYPELQKAVMSSFEIIGQKASMDIFNVDMTDFMYPKGK